MSAASPGPWTWSEHPNDYKNHEDIGGIVDAGGKAVCNFGNGEQYYPSEGDPPSPDDLAIMLAAPELLDACEKSVALLTSIPDWAGGEVTRAAVKVLRAAIAKAEPAAPPAKVSTADEIAALYVVPLPPTPRCEWRDCSTPASADRIDGAANKWALCVTHADNFDRSGYGTIALVKR